MNGRAAYRQIRPDEHLAVADLVQVGFGNVHPPEDYVKRTAPEEFRVLEAGGQVVSVLREARWAQYWLGRPVPSAQVLQFVTATEQRGRGYGKALLAAHLAELRAAGIPTVSLRPSTLAFYRGAGYECAGAWSAYEARAEHLPRALAPYRARRLRLDDLGEAMAIYDRVAPSRHGAFARSGDAWRRLLWILQREGRAVAWLLEDDAGPAGWILASMEHAHPDSRIVVHDWGCLPGADAALLALLATYDTMRAVVTWSGPDPDPALLLLPAESARLIDRYHWMLRIVDLPAAFEARPYPPAATGTVTLRVDDPLCPWNSGTWRLEIAGGKCRCERLEDGADGALASVRGLAPLFTGFCDPAELVRAGLLAGLGSQDLEVLRAAFASPRPWTSEAY